MGATFEFVDGILDQIVDKQKESGEQSLTEAERIVSLVWHASGIIENGGFPYFYEQGLNPDQVAQAYLSIGSAQCAELIRLSSSLFPNNQKGAAEVVSSKCELFENLSREFWKADRITERLLLDYIVANKALILAGKIQLP